MNEPSSTENGEEDNIPAWMQSVSEETLYNAPSSPSTKDVEPAPEDPPSGTSTGSASSYSGDPNAERSRPSLRQKLSISLGDSSEIPEPDPDLQPTVVGRVRADLNRQLEKAASVLETRYADGFTKSLLIEFALRRTLLDLREQDEDSALVRWLDSLLPQR